MISLDLLEKIYEEESGKRAPIDPHRHGLLHVYDKGFEDGFQSGLAQARHDARANKDNT